MAQAPVQDDTSAIGPPLRNFPAAVEALCSETVAEHRLHSIPSAVAQITTDLTAIGARGGENAFATRGFRGNTPLRMLADSERHQGRGNISLPVDNGLIEEFEGLKARAPVIQRQGAIGGFVNAVPQPPLEGTPPHLATALAGSDDRLRRGFRRLAERGARLQGDGERGSPGHVERWGR